MSKRNRDKYKKNLNDQMYEKLKSLQAFGESKKAAKEDGSYVYKIFSTSTFNDYKKHCGYFIKWVRTNHPEITKLSKAKPLVNEWLQTRVDADLSAWTISLEVQALSKLYGIKPDDPDRFKPPKRRREDISRSRVDTVRDKHFSKTNNAELIKFCQGTGVRRNVCQRLVGDDLWSRERMELRIKEIEALKNRTLDDVRDLENLRQALDTFPEQSHFIHHRKDKGGKYRFAPIIGPAKKQIIERFESRGKAEKVWLYVNGNADVHSYRSEYATSLYKMYARPINEIPYDKINHGTGYKYQSEVYCCQKDEKGKRLDKMAMKKASIALGHNRIDVIANNYIRNL